jgi:hypothetical protein
MNTPVWLNTIDSTKPTSSVFALAATQTASSFLVQWSGSDVGAGVQDYSVFVSDNGAAYAAWLTNTTATQGTFTGVNGHAYGFYSLARDLVGNIESPKTTADASTTVVIAGSCNVTGDAGAGVSDVQSMINQALGILPAVNDLNGDGAVNVADVQLVMNAALNLGCLSRN